MEKTDKYKTVAALVRCFFGAFSAGIIDCHVKDYAEKMMREQKLSSQKLNQLVGVFVSIHSRRSLSSR